MLEIKLLNKNFNESVIKNFSYSFNEGKLYFLKGKNGSGKTTLLRLIKGVYNEDSGDIILKNNLDKSKEVVLIDENFRSFFHRLTVNQNLEYFNSLNKAYNSINREISKNLFDLFRIEDLKNKKFADLSNGQMQLISIVRGFSSFPKIILLDEVFNTLDNDNKFTFKLFLKDYIKTNQCLVIFTSHHEIFDESEIIKIYLK